MFHKYLILNNYFILPCGDKPTSRARASTLRALTAVAALSGAPTAAPWSGDAHATQAAYPTRPVRYVVGGSVGGGADILARTIAQKLSEAWGQPVVIDNRPGGGGVVATEIVAKSPRDGYTLLMAYTSHVINPSLYPKLSYDTLRDFAPITQIATMPNVLVVHPSLPADSVPALIALARKKPLSYASTGSGASNHLAAEMLAHMAGVKLLHVPYRGAGPAVTAILSAQTDMMFATMASILPQVKSGKLRALGTTGAKRSAAMPELPTISESGVPGYEANAWFATYASSGTSPALIQRLNGDIARVIASAEVRDRLAAQGAEAITGTPQELARYTQTEIARWGRVIRESGARAD